MIYCAGDKSPFSSKSIFWFNSSILCWIIFVKLDSKYSKLPINYSWLELIISAAAVGVAALISETKSDIVISV